MAARLRLGVLGGFRAILPGGSPAALPTRKAEALLAFLACRAGEPQSREQLAALLWGDRGDRQARHSLSQSLSSLRAGLGDDLFLASCGREAVALDIARLDLDLAEFTRLAAGGTIEELDAAAGLYRGPRCSCWASTAPSWSSCPGPSGCWPASTTAAPTPESCCTSAAGIGSRASIVARWPWPGASWPVPERPTTPSWPTSPAIAAAWRCTATATTPRRRGRSRHAAAQRALHPSLHVAGRGHAAPGTPARGRGRRPPRRRAGRGPGRGGASGLGRTPARRHPGPARSAGRRPALPCGRRAGAAAAAAASAGRGRGGPLAPRPPEPVPADQSASPV